MKKPLQILLLSLILGGLAVGACLFGSELKKDSDTRTKRERMQFVRDSLQVEKLKQELNDK